MVFWGDRRLEVHLKANLFSSNRFRKQRNTKKAMKKRLLEEKNRFLSLFTQSSSQSKNSIQMANIQKCQWNLEEIKSFEQQIESDSNVAITAANEGLISDIVSNALSAENKREIQFKSWILLQQILEIWHNKKQDQINIETKGNKESSQNKNENSQMYYMPQDFTTGLVILLTTEDISIGAQIINGIKDSLSTQLETKERIASELAKKEIIDILMKPFMLIQKEEIYLNNQILITNGSEQTASEINYSIDANS
ncbi:MAG: hypothetical protein EZS28_001146 [Streblomastix strix]|uniref:Uncharacterized protein n=1 Tax=Streblomastix strix TaxID=222440 RepID=A0A5J4X8W8_9EUKA|nr:MAG: hypothetical protein EZS28_001146 [Streblomastix strix]